MKWDINPHVSLICVLIVNLLDLGRSLDLGVARSFDTWD